MLSTYLNKTEKIADDLYMITETESIHCYLLLGSEKALLIDVGWGYEDIHPIIASITDKPVILAVTHGDPDHALGAMHFDEVCIHPLDYGKMLMNDNEKEKRDMLEYRMKKLPSIIPHIDPEAYYKTSLQGKAKPVFLTDHQIIDLGDKHIECILTPGHSYGHIMFLEKETGRLFSGDQLTDGHNIWHFLSSDKQAPLSVTYSTLKKLSLRRDEISSIYPAHQKTPISINCLDDIIECLEWELKENWRNDTPFHSAQGDGYQHIYKSVNLIYSDERLEDYLGIKIQRD